MRSLGGALMITGTAWATNAIVDGATATTTGDTREDRKSVV